VAKRIGELLVEGGVLSQSQLEQALFAQRKDGRKLGQVLVDLGLVSEIQVTQTLSRQLSVPWVSLYHVDFSRSLLNLVPREISERYCAVPIFVRRIRKQGETLYVAMDDPTNDAAIQDLARAAGLPVKPMIACPSDIRAAIRVYYLGEAPPPPPPAPSASRLGVAKEVAAAPASAVAAPVAPVAPAARTIPSPPPSPAPRVAPETPTAGDARDSAPEIQSQEKEVVPQARRPRMIALTLLDGTTISLPAPKKRAEDPEGDVPDARPRRRSPPAPGEAMSDQLTARDLVSAMRAVAHGADASEILGETPRWEAMFSALLSLMLRKGLIADWEFVEEFRKV
jgi:type IV pilus assembly protein PilB